MNKPGIVYLIGAGPGDSGLLTLKAQAVLKQAEVIVYDRLVNPRLLAYAQETAKKIYVGKAVGHHCMAQTDINQLLIRLAQAGKIVARLKGGDPLVFGRGGEEALALKAQGLPFVFIPGVTSALAVPTYAGIPVTHRQLATSFAVITGHEDPAKEASSLRWSGLATAVDTLIFLMGVENIKTITENLLMHGRAATTPAAFIRWGTKAEQFTLVTTLGEAAHAAQEAQLKPPAIFIVGEVVALRQQLNWFETLPLFGKTIVVTRARPQASVLTGQLEQLGAHVLEVPTIKIAPPPDPAPLEQAVKNLSAYQWVIFTSVNGVEHFFAALHKQGLDSRAFAAAKLAAIGTETAAALGRQGLRVDVVPKTFQAEALAEALAPHLQAGHKVLLVRAQQARDVLPQNLKALGARVNTVAAYQTLADTTQREALVTALQQNKVDCLTFTSSSTVRNLATALESNLNLLQKTTIAAIGPITASTCRELGLNVAVQASEYTIHGLVQALAAFYKE